MRNKTLELLALAAVGCICLLGCGREKPTVSEPILQPVAPSAPAVPKVESPKDGDYRIVDNHDGTYSVQCFWSDPRWQDVGRANAMSLEQARELKKTLERPSRTEVK